MSNRHLEYIMDEDFWFAALCRKYVQSADARHREMGLQYMEAETHDLAKEIVKLVRSELAKHLNEQIKEALK